jgi:hypothetical protein
VLLFARNVVSFVRILRAAGVPAGADRARLALRALCLCGVAEREVVKSALACTLLGSHDERAIFEQAFAAFWRDPGLDPILHASRLPQAAERAAHAARSRRIAAALYPHAPETAAREADARIEIDAAWTFSAGERLRRADFETMSPAEFREAARLAARLAATVAKVKTRRHEPARRGAVDWLASLKAGVRQGGDVWPLLRRRRRAAPAPLVVLADISGSMERITRMLLHFCHGLARAQLRCGARVEIFLFGTRLTRVTRQMLHRDADIAIERVANRVEDWGGGTRIGGALERFNRDWSRRVLGQRAIVLLVTDGLDLEGAERLGAEAARLARSARELIWLNPLLRFDAFEAKAAGIRALLPHVGRHLPVHNIDSLTALAAALAWPAARCHAQSIAHGNRRSRPVACVASRRLGRAPGP